MTCAVADKVILIGESGVNHCESFNCGLIKNLQVDITAYVQVWDKGEDEVWHCTASWKVRNIAVTHNLV